MQPTGNYLLELGTEELPVSLLESAPDELVEKLSTGLKKRNVQFSSITPLATPRRLAVVITGLSQNESAVEEVIKGPPVSAALDKSGQPTPAALGFAKKQGVQFADLTQERMDGSDYLILRRHVKPPAIAEHLQVLVPEAVEGVSGSHFMVWDDSRMAFSRPIRWLVSLLDNAVLPLTLGQLTASNQTRGHRFFAAKPSITLDLTSTVQETYETLLETHGQVLVNPAKRREQIWADLQKTAQSLGGVVIPNESLLDTVTMLVETPSIVYGSFNDAFLSLPKAVITTVMIQHQKYFPVETKDGALLPYFMTVSNNPNPDAVATIRKGNEKVLQARLEDAAFFYRTDQQKPLAEYVEDLKGLTFQKGLGSVWDKTQRLVSLVSRLAPPLSLSEKEQAHAARAALLCKADLVTHLVRELTELQGAMGTIYAALNQENNSVSGAIQEHYAPRFTGDEVATSPVGIALSMADKLDTLFAVFSQNEARLPTGSKDPMGLRRMAGGILQTVLENNLTVDVNACFEAAYQNLGSLAQKPKQETIQAVSDFLLQRFKGVLLDKGFSYDAIDAVLECDTSPWTNLINTMTRMDCVKSLQNNPAQLLPLYEPANRTMRILGKAYQPKVTLADIQPQYFEKPIEQVLFDQITQVDLSQKTPAEQCCLLSGWCEQVSQFYEDVMVNAEDAKVKANRYALLSLLNQQYQRIADWSKLVVSVS